MSPTEFSALVDAKNKGGPISWKSIHRQANLRDLTDMPYDEEVEEIIREQMDVQGREPAIDIDEDAVA